MPGTRGPVPVPLESSTTHVDLTQQILDFLSSHDAIQTNTDFPNIPQGEIKAALDRLASRLMVNYTTQDKEQVQLTSEGKGICENGSHEFIVWKAVQGSKASNGLPVKDLAGIVGAETAKVGQGNAFKLKWISKQGDSLVSSTPEGSTPEDKTRTVLQQVQKDGTIDDTKVLADYKKRKLVQTMKVIHYSVQKGEKYAREIPVEVTDLTAEMLENGSWKTANFKPYNFNALGASQNAGALHPLSKVREEFRKIFFHQGFVEMPTARYVTIYQI